MIATDLFYSWRNQEIKKLFNLQVMVKAKWINADNAVHYIEKIIYNTKMQKRTA